MRRTGRCSSLSGAHERSSATPSSTWSTPAPLTPAMSRPFPAIAMDDCRQLHGTDEWVDIESQVQTATAIALTATSWTA